jgi:hypothetical protein
MIYFVPPINQTSQVIIDRKQRYNAAIPGVIALILLISNIQL